MEHCRRGHSYGRRARPANTRPCPSAPTQNLSQFQVTSPPRPDLACALVHVIQELVVIRSSTETWFTAPCLGVFDGYAKFVMHLPSARHSDVRAPPVPAMSRLGDFHVSPRAEPLFGDGIQQSRGVIKSNTILSSPCSLPVHPLHVLLAFVVFRDLFVHRSLCMLHRSIGLNELYF